MAAPIVPCPDCGRLLRSNVLERHRNGHYSGPEGQSTVALADQQEMIRLYRSGWSQERIAAQLLWSKSTVGRVLQLHGESLPARRIGNRPKLPDEQILQVAELYARGLSVREVASRLGLSYSSTLYRLRAGEVQMRSSGWGQQRKAARRRLEAA